MNNAELIKALRYCPSHGCGRCVALDANGACTGHGVVGIMNSAADALEAAEKRIVELNTKCADLQSHINSMESEIEELLPKEGEWNIRETASGDVEAKCPKCGFEMLVNQPGNGLLMVSELLYCPHCGSRMEQEDER